ncbi:hypothetical protein RUND412_002830 [Rhizina undulata]
MGILRAKYARRSAAIKFDGTEMSEEVNRSQQRENFPSIIYYGFAPFGFPSQPVQQAPLQRNRVQFGNAVPAFYKVLPGDQVVRRQAASEQSAPLNDEHEASSSRTANPSIGNALQAALDPRENAALAQPFRNFAPSPAMAFMHDQQQFFSPPPRQHTISGLTSPNDAGNVVSSNAQAAFNPPSPAVIRATPLASNVNPGGGTQPWNVAPGVSTPSASPTVNAGTTNSNPARRHACPVCGRRFARPSGLKAHNVSHTGERRKYKLSDLGILVADIL